MVQMKVVFNEVNENMKHAEELIEMAAIKGADIAVLPECSDLGWGNPLAKELGEGIPGKVSDFYCKIAEKNNIYIVVGLTERDGNEAYNTALLIDDKGKIQLKHRKINVLTGVEDVYSIGNCLSVAKTPLGAIGVDICADNACNSMVLGHALARMGAQIILSPSSWAVRPDRDIEKEPYGDDWFIPYKEIAKLYHIPIIGVSNVGQVSSGTWKGWKAIGNSIAVDKNAEVIAVLPYGEEAERLEIIDVELGEAKVLGTALTERSYQL